MTADESIKKIKDSNDKEWHKIKEDILEFIGSEAPKEEKRKFVPLGYLEYVCMMCSSQDKTK